MRGHFIAFLYPYIELQKRQLAYLHTCYHHHRLRFIPLKRLPQLQTAFNIHKPKADHRVRGACAFLLVR